MASQQCSLTLDIMSGTSWQTCYQRSCKSGGRKVLKCFPTCRGVHPPGSLKACFDPVSARLRTTDLGTGRFVCLAYFQPAGGEPLSSPVPWESVEKEGQSPRSPLNQFFIVEDGQPIPSDSGCVLFNFRPSGWHYGWKSSRGKVQSEHQLRVAALHLAENVEGVQIATLVATAVSPPFRLMSTRAASARRKRLAAGSDSKQA